MKKQTVKYSDENIGKIKIIKDFLPKPEDLVLQDQTIKVTLSLSKSSIIFLYVQPINAQRDYKPALGAKNVYDLYEILQTYRHLFINVHDQ